MNSSKEDKNQLEAVINIRRVAKVVKGGRRFGFSALVAVGTEDGKIGVGLGKAGEVPAAINKAKQKALKSAISVKLKGTTIPHGITVRYKGAKVMMKPASKGTGVIAGGPVRRILECSPLRDVLSKSLGSANHVNVARATILCLQQLTNLEEIAALRGKKKEAIYSVED